MELGTQQLGENIMVTLKRLIPQAPNFVGPVIFKSGVSFKALKPPKSEYTDKAFLALMVYMPYFDISTIPDRRTESLTLAEYRLLEGGEEVTQDPSSGDQNKDLLVHQAWFMMFNNGLASLLIWAS